MRDFPEQLRLIARRQTVTSDEFERTLYGAADQIEHLQKYSLRYSQRVEQLYLLDSYIDGLVGEIEKGVDMDRLKKLAKIYRHNKNEGLYD